MIVVNVLDIGHAAKNLKKKVIAEGKEHSQMKGFGERCQRDFRTLIQVHYQDPDQGISLPEANTDSGEPPKKRRKRPCCSYCRSHGCPNCAFTRPTVLRGKTFISRFIDN